MITPEIMGAVKVPDGINRVRFGRNSAGALSVLSERGCQRRRVDREFARAWRAPGF